MVEGTSLENWRARKGTVGSNPTPSVLSQPDFAEEAVRAAWDNSLKRSAAHL